MAKVADNMMNPLEEIRQIFEVNPLAWGKFYFPHYFRSKSADFHLKILETCMNYRRVAVQAPRESAKSTIAAFLYSFHQIMFKKRHFIVIVQNTYSKAKETLNNIKDEIRDNDKLKKDFKIEIRRDQEGDSILVHEDGFPIRILCKGAEQIGSLRGERFRAYRPDLILVDDLEDDEMVKSAERRRGLQDLFDEALVPAGDRETCQYIAIGTILHDDSLMAKLVSEDEYKDYEKLFYKAHYQNLVTDTEESLWPEKWSLTFLRGLMRTKPNTYAKEYQGDPVIGSLKNFNKEDFRRWAIENDHYLLYDAEGKITSKGLLANCKAAIGCDLAWEEKKTADFTVIMPAFLTPDSDILIDTYFCQRGVRPDQFEDVLFRMEAKLRLITNKYIPIGFEKAKLEKVTKWILTQAMRRRNRFLSLKDVSWVMDKISRIVTPLQPRYKMHSIYHRSGMGDLEHQLERIPSGKHDDLPDAEQIVVRLLEFAPKVKKGEATQEDPIFNRLRQMVIKRKKPKQFVFGNRYNKPYGLPARESIF